MTRLLGIGLAVLITACGGGGALTADQSERTTASDAGDIQTLHLPGVEESKLLPVTLGNRWEYELDIDGVGRATQSQTITAADREGRDATKVTMHNEFEFDDDKLPGGDGDLGYIFHADGSLEVPPGQGPSLLGVESETSGTEGNMLWPSRAELESGQPHAGSYVTKIGNIEATTEFTVMGRGKQDVKVPAGRFSQCQVMVSELTITALGTTSHATVTYWFAPDVGWVKFAYDNELSGSMTGELTDYDVG